MTNSISELQRIYQEAECLLDWSQIQHGLKELAIEITGDYQQKMPVLLCVMNGGLVFSGQLLPLLSFPLEVAYCHATRYRGKESGSDLEWKVAPSTPLKDRHVLILDDILDEGHTLLALIDACHQQGAASVASSVLLDKQHNRKATPGLVADYCKLTIPDRYVFGCGMDYRGYWRNAAGIFAVKGL